MGIRILVCLSKFSKDLIPGATRLTQKEIGLRMDGRVASFRVLARGMGCIPVLDTRERMAGRPVAAR